MTKNRASKKAARAAAAATSRSYTAARRTMPPVGTDPQPVAEQPLWRYLRAKSDGTSARVLLITGSISSAIRAGAAIHAEAAKEIGPGDVVADPTSYTRWEASEVWPSVSDSLCDTAQGASWCTYLTVVHAADSTYPDDLRDLWTGAPFITVVSPTGEMPPGLRSDDLDWQSEVVIARADRDTLTFNEGSVTAPIPAAPQTRWARLTMRTDRENYQQPMPYDIALDGSVGYQSMWSGDPHHLLGFQQGDEQSLIRLASTSHYFAEEVEGLRPVFASGDGQIWAHRHAVHGCRIWNSDAPLEGM